LNRKGTQLSVSISEREEVPGAGKTRRIGKIIKNSHNVGYYWRSCSPTTRLKRGAGQGGQQ